MMEKKVYNFCSTRNKHLTDCFVIGILGPSHWGEQYNTCFGKYQSPIDINSLTVKSAQLPALKFTGFDDHSNQTMLENNGHTGE